MKHWIIILVFGFCVHVSAQDINHNGTMYTVKGKTILKEGKDVTETLALEEQQSIKAALAEKKKEAKAIEKREKELKKAEKEQKKVEKKQKQAEKALKQKEKIRSKFEKSVKKHDQAVNTYEKLKNKGKLSPIDESKWLKKIEKLRVAREKIKRKL
ncbi:hypothetical protein ACFFU9_01740 [Mariniflexile ostreae]|uniref:Uncharacterized protein n=1 Tax=Mariniflexile ostreae TaxID=1520892 RepID=A0ABV5F7P9_9FLAO